MENRDDRSLTPRNKRNSRIRCRHINRLFSLFFCLFAVVFIVSLVMITKTYIKGRSEQEAFDELASLIPSTSEQTDTAITDLTPLPTLTSLPTLDGTHHPEEMQYTEYQYLYELNNDFIGWITIDNTEINYPVMYTPDEPEYYLHRAFDGSNSQCGTPFIGEGGNIDSDCYIIYGHNMKNDTMFGTLDYYAKGEFCKENQTFTITTITEKRVYEVFAAVKARVLLSDETGFRYYNQSGNLTEKEYLNLTEWLIDNSLYDTGVIPSYGEQIVILSTCSKHTDNGRFIVAARLVDDGKND